LSKVSEFVARRRAIARSYDEICSQLIGVEPLDVRSGVESAYHLYVVRLEPDFLSTDRGRLFAALRAEGIGVNVHYLPVYLHRFYRERFGTGPGVCPRAEAAYDVILSLPIFPAMSDQDVEDVIQALCKVVNHYAIDTRFAAVAGAR
jgi:perosamine synthetase